MIDTIVMRLHRARKYKNVVRIMDQHDTKGFSTLLGKVSEEDMERLHGQGITDPGQMVEVLKMNRTGKFLVRSKMAKQVSASSHYQFVYKVDHTHDFIEFNFSIPKYKYGSNVMMFVDHEGDAAYAYHYCVDLQHNIKRAYDKLRGFLRGFFRREFPGVQIDPRHVEVHRIDVCFNQIFRSRADALRQLEYQKHKTKKHTRAGNDGYKEYNTSLMYVTGNYSAKIYHKGSEYLKNDAKEHKRYNELEGRQTFNIAQYQAFADRMLRYELTLRTGMLNYLHKAHLFRRNCPFWKRDFTIYKEVEAAQQRNERIAKRIGTLPEEQKEAYREAHPYEKIPREGRQVYKYVTKIVNQRTYFTFEVNPEDALYNEQLVNVNRQRKVYR